MVIRIAAKGAKHAIKNLKNWRKVRKQQSIRRKEQQYRDARLKREFKWMADYKKKTGEFPESSSREITSMVREWNVIKKEMDRVKSFKAPKPALHPKLVKLIRSLPSKTRVKSKAIVAVKGKPRYTKEIKAQNKRDAIGGVVWDGKLKKWYRLSVKERVKLLRQAKKR